MKYFKLKHPVSFPITACWGITATKYAVIIYLGLRGFVIELPQRKLTPRVPDALRSGHCEHVPDGQYCPYCKRSYHTQVTQAEPMLNRWANEKVKH